MPEKMPKSDFDRYEDKQKDMNESQSKGKQIYEKGASRNGKEKK